MRPFSVGIGGKVEGLDIRFEILQGTWGLDGMHFMVPMKQVADGRWSRVFEATYRSQEAAYGAIELYGDEGTHYIVVPMVTKLPKYPA